MKILCVDDSETNLILLSAALKKLGHTSVTALNGHDAIEQYQKENPDLIILDVVMEDMDGYEVAKKIRSFPQKEWVPIIFLSLNMDDESVAKGIEAGGDDYLTKPISEIKLAAKIKAMQRIADMQKKLVELTKALVIQSATDPLTGVYNRGEFEQHLQARLSYAARHEKLVALFFLDLDNFKEVNDSLGHQVGDALLIAIVKRLRTCLRTEDFIARLGGDEFAIILSDFTNKKDLAEIAQKILTSIVEPYQLLDHEVNMSASIGIAYYPQSTADDLLKHADIAMYRAKDLGRNNFQFYNTAVMLK